MRRIRIARARAGGRRLRTTVRRATVARRTVARVARGRSVWRPDEERQTKGRRAVPGRAGGRRPAGARIEARPPAFVPGRILLFVTTQAALRAEDVLLEAGVDVDVVPKPEGLAGLCGIALEVPAEELSRAREVLAGDGPPFELYDPGGGVDA